MLKMIFISFVLALQNIKDNFLHTVLSVLGIVIGVAALVAILSFIDGMEKFAKEQISGTTSLQSVIIQTNTSKTLDGVRMQKQEWGYMDYARLKELEKALVYPARAYIVLSKPQEIQLPDSANTVGVVVAGVAEEVAPKSEILAGRMFTTEELENKSPVIIVNDVLAEKLTGGKEHTAALGRQLQVKGQQMRVVGVIVGGGAGEAARAAIPITHFSEQELKESPPSVVLEAARVEDVAAIKIEAEKWLVANLAKNKDDFSVMTNEYRVEQLTKGILLFKVVMGLITGIAVLVGGIGIMNVLLISVTERTSEIGVRKAMGAKKRDILMQFLSESITVAGFGSLLGLGLGVLGTLAVVPIIQHITKAPFEAAFTASTIALVAFLALVLGVVFGTYPAMRAARLDPVEAIRRE